MSMADEQSDAVVSADHAKQRYLDRVNGVVGSDRGLVLAVGWLAAEVRAFRVEHSPLNELTREVGEAAEHVRKVTELATESVDMAQASLKGEDDG